MLQEAPLQPHQPFMASRYAESVFMCSRKSFRLVAGYHKNVCSVGIAAGELDNNHELRHVSFSILLLHCSCLQAILI